MKKKSIAIFQVPSLKTTPSNVAVSIALLFCQRKFYGVSKVFLGGYLKDVQWLSFNVVKKKEEKKGGVGVTVATVMPKMEKN